jgi:hypothetical protein
MRRISDIQPTHDALWEHLMDLVPQIEALVADSICDFAIKNHCITRDGRWLYTVSALYEGVTVEQVVDDGGLCELVERLEGFLEDEP